MMKKLPSVNFEELVARSLQVDPLPGLSSDAEFLQKLRQNLTKVQSRPALYQIWLSGISNGLVAASIGILLMVGLNILPPLLVNASVSSAGIIQTKIVQATVNQQILWQQMVSLLRKI